MSGLMGGGPKAAPAPYTGAFTIVNGKTIQTPDSVSGKSPTETMLEDQKKKSGITIGAPGTLASTTGGTVLSGGREGL